MKRRCKGLKKSRLSYSISVSQEDISTSHFIIIIKSKVSIFPIVDIFFVIVCLKWLYCHMLSDPHNSSES